MTLVIGAWTIGIILTLLAIGVYVSFRICDFADITTDGSFTLGAAVDRKSTRLNSSHTDISRMPSSA